MTALLSGPWSLLARIGCALLIASALLGYGYVKGKSAQQDEDAIAQAKQIESDEAVRADHAAKSGQVLQKREDQQHAIDQTSPAVAAVVHAARVRPDEPQCGARVPAASRAVQLPAQAAEPRAAPGAGYAELEESEDLQQCRKLIVDYGRLREWVLVNGGDRP